jgi:hypothetical protein
MLEFTPDGRFALSTSPANTRIWDTKNWTMVALVPGRTGRLWPDGTKIALWREERSNVIEVWNLPDLMKKYHR